MPPAPSSLLPGYSARSVRQGGRSYFQDEQGVRLPSVTTILNATKPPEAREALMRWRDRLGAEVANQVSAAASRRGTLTHKQIHHFLLGKDIFCADAAKPYWDSLKPILSDLDNVRLIENVVFHHDLKYAGKVDCVASFQGIPCVCDWKTADSPKGSVERLYDGPLQLAAYCGAVNHCYQQYELNIRHALLIVALPAQPAEIFWFDPEQMVTYWQQWQERVAQFYRRDFYRRDRSDHW